MVTELAKWQHVTARRQEAAITVMSDTIRGTAKGLDTQEVWRWLIEHGVHKGKKEGVPVRMLPIIHNHKKQQQRSRRLKVVSPIKSQTLFSVLRLESIFRSKLISYT